MTTADISAVPTAASRAPIRMGAYALIVRDLPRVSEFYQQAVGLAVLDQTPRSAVLGNDGVALLHLEQRQGIAADDVKTAGLHHCAFLMPTRRDLADWYRHSRRSGITITRTGDHAVNEALYFDDPEGNGVECYADRPPHVWVWDADGKVAIPSVPVDVDNLAKDASGGDGQWSPPAGMRIGHINIRVGGLDAADAFYCGALGLDHTCRNARMTFMASGRYHHHMAANIFTSDGAGQREPDRAGLAWFAFEHDPKVDIGAIRARLQAAGAPVSACDGGLETADPWGNSVRIVAGR